MKKSSKTISSSLVGWEVNIWIIQDVFFWIHICRWGSLSAILVAFECSCGNFQESKGGLPMEVDRVREAQ